MSKGRSRGSQALAAAKASATVAAVTSIALTAFVGWAHHWRREWLSAVDVDHLLGTASFLSAYVAVVTVVEGRSRKRARIAASCSERKQ